MRYADNIANNDTQVQIDGKWVVARPLSFGFLSRLKDAWGVLIGKYDAVKYYKQ